MSKAINRRHFLRGAGVAIALPMLEAMGPSLKAAVVNRKPVKRVVCISNNYGIYKKAFFPKEAGANYEMPDTLKQLASQSFNNQAQDQAQDQAGDGDPETGPWRFTLDVPSAMPFLQHCRNRDLRERLYLAYVTRASSAELDNAPLIDEILQGTPNLLGGSVVKPACF